MSTQAIKDKLSEIYEDLAANVTHIYCREDLMLAVDLVFHSVLRFKFRKQWVAKGWVEALILGDTREGKTETVARLINHYRSGELTTGETTSYAGLLGGLQQNGKKWAITWGKIPLNDRRLLAIDEASGMAVEDIALLSGVRSSGVAQLTKIQTEKTMSRTRLIWISNPRSGRKLETYTFGISAVRELIGKAEDISRFDLAVTIANGEVSPKVINRGMSDIVPHKYTSDLCANLVLWAWTRPDDAVVFGHETEEAILDLSEELSKEYSPAIPLVQPAEQRIKIARMAVALAVRLFSTDDGQTVLVKPEHAQHIVDFLRQIYNKSSMSYNLFSMSQSMPSDYTIDHGAIPVGLLQEYGSYADGSPLTTVLLTQGVVKKTPLMDSLAWDKERAASFFNWAVTNRLLSPVYSGFAKTALFNNLLKYLAVEKSPSLPDEEPPF